MSLKLIELMQGQLGAAFVSQTATHLGESEADVSKAVSGLLPAVVAGLAHHAHEPQIFSAISAASPENLLSQLHPSTVGSGTVEQLSSSVFGESTATLLENIASYAGVSVSSAAAILKMVVAAAVGVVAKYSKDENLDAAGTLALLEKQKGSAATLLPAGLSMAGLGLGSWAAAEDLKAADKPLNTATAEPAGEYDIDGNSGEITGTGDMHVLNDMDHEEGNGSIWKWLLPLVLLALAAWFMWKQCAEKNETTTTTTAQDTAVRDRDDSATASLESVPANSETVIDLNGNPIKDTA